MSMPMQTLETPVISITPLTHNVVELVVELKTQDFSFIPGQFTQFLVGEKLYRSYSIASLPEQLPTATFCIKYEEGGVGSQYVQSLNPGDLITMRGPLGRFTVNYEKNDFLFVATGVGIAPFLSMIPALFKAKPHATVTLLFGVRNEADIFYHDFFEAISNEFETFNFVPLLSQPQGAWQGGVGRVTAYLNERYQDIAHADAYICGSTAVVTDTRALLLEKGHAMENIHLEIFT
jgi:ferredoxin-NADP reductase